MPPHWVLQDQQVGPVHTPQFFDDMRWQRAVFRGVALFGLNIETMRINPAPVVLAPLAGWNSHGVQVTDCRGPARRLQHFNSRADELGVERVRLRMSEDEVGAHGMAFLPTGSKSLSENIMRDCIVFAA